MPTATRCMKTIWAASADTIQNPSAMERSWQLYFLDPHCVILLDFILPNVTMNVSADQKTLTLT